jgi:hypothetical protein
MCLLRIVRFLYVLYSFVVCEISKMNIVYQYVLQGILLKEDVLRLLRLNLSQLLINVTLFFIYGSTKI